MLPQGLRRLGGVTFISNPHGLEYQVAAKR